MTAPHPLHALGIVYDASHPTLCQHELLGGTYFHDLLLLHLGNQNVIERCKCLPASIKCSSAIAWEKATNMRSQIRLVEWRPEHLSSLQNLSPAVIDEHSTHRKQLKELTVNDHI